LPANRRTANRELPGELYYWIATAMAFAASLPVLNAQFGANGTSDVTFGGFMLWVGAFVILLAGAAVLGLVFGNEKSLLVMLGLFAVGAVLYGAVSSADPLSGAAVGLATGLIVIVGTIIALAFFNHLAPVLAVLFGLFAIGAADMVSEEVKRARARDDIRDAVDDAVRKRRF